MCQKSNDNKTRMKPRTIFVLLLNVLVVNCEDILSDRSYLRVDGGVYSKLTIAFDDGVPQPKHCPSFLDNLEVCFLGVLKIAQSGLVHFLSTVKGCVKNAP